MNILSHNNLYLNNQYRTTKSPVCNNATTPFCGAFGNSKGSDSFEIESCVNPVTKLPDKKLTKTINYLKDMGIKDYLRVASSGLDSKGIFNPAVYRILSLFYHTAPEGVFGKAMYCCNMLSRYSKIGNFGFTLIGGDDNPIDFINSLKDAKGDFNLKNEKFLYKILKIGHEQYEEDGISVSQVAQLVNNAKGEDGVVDSTLAKIACDILEKFNDYEIANTFLTDYATTPSERREKTFEILSQNIQSEKSLYSNFGNFSDFCFDDNLNILPENLEFAIELSKATDLQLGGWTFKLAEEYPQCRDFILEYVKASDNPAYDSYHFANYFSVFDEKEENFDLIIDNAIKYFNTRATFEGLSDFFFASSVLNEEDDGYRTFNKNLFDKSLDFLDNYYQMFEGEFDSLPGTVAVGILSGDFHPQTLPYSSKIGIKKYLESIQGPEFDFDKDKISKALKIVNESINDTDISYPIDRTTKFDFIKTILKSEPNSYTKFEKTLIDSIPLFESMEEGLPLAYPRTKFVEDLCAVSQDSDKLDEILEKLNIDLVFDEDLNPISYNGFIALDKLDLDNPIDSKIHELATKFLFENKITTESSELNDDLNLIITALPEFINIIGKKQHKTQSHTLDIHCLLASAYSISNPDYLDKLNQNDRCVLKFSSLLHDIAKKENMVDTGHQYLSSEYVNNISSKFFTHPYMREKITEFVSNHHWLGGYQNKEKGYSAPDVAIRFRRGNEFEMAKIMAKSDLMAVSIPFYEKLKDSLSPENLASIQENLDNIKMSTNYLYSDRIVNKAKAAKHTVEKNGVTYNVLDLRHLPDDADVGEFGFQYGKKKKDLRFSIHMIDSEDLKNGLTTAKSLTKPSIDGILSESLISAKNSRTYRERKFGLLMSQSPANILSSHDENIYSGYQKDFADFIQNLTESTNVAKYRWDFFYNLLALLGVKYRVDADEDDVLKFYNEVLSKISNISQLDVNKTYTLGTRSFDGYELTNALLNSAEQVINKDEDFHNELIVYLPIIEAALAKVDDFDEVPQELLDFSKENNLPVVLI